MDLSAQLNHGVDHRDATARLKDRLARIPNVLTNPAPDDEILTFHPQHVLSRVHIAHQRAISCSRARGSGYWRSTWRMKSSASASVGTRPDGGTA